MSEFAVRVVDISKRYEIAIQRRHDTLRDQLAHNIRSMLRRDRRRDRSTTAFWALKNVWLDIKRGEVLGLIKPQRRW